MSKWQPRECQLQSDCYNQNKTGKHSTVLNRCFIWWVSCTFQLLQWIVVVAYTPKDVKNADIHLFYLWHQAVEDIYSLTSTSQCDRCQKTSPLLLTNTSYQMCLCRFTKTVLDCQNCSENSIIYSCVIFGCNFWHLTSMSSRTFLTTRKVRGCQKVFWQQNNYSAYLLDNVWHLRSMSSWTFPRHTGTLHTARWFWCVSNDPILLGCIRGQYLPSLCC